jgi:ubiquinone/menaquinone biosynthesis C-methylase UbiE
VSELILVSCMLIHKNAILFQFFKPIAGCTMLISNLSTYFFKKFLSCKSYSDVFTARGTQYDEDAIKKYVNSEKWPYISHFLLKPILPMLNDIKNQKILDAGCGTGMWVVPLALREGKVYGIDLQEKMIAEAKKVVASANLSNRVKLKVGDVTRIPYTKENFDKVLSINVACNLPSTTYEDHFKEIHRVLKPGGTSIVVIPTSLDIVFTNGEKNQTMILKHVTEVLSDLKSDPNSSEIIESLNLLPEILSATFIIKNGRLTLVTDINQLDEGQKIWRKLPGMTIPNRYHSEGSLLKAIKNANLSITKIDHSCFSSEEERKTYNNSVSSHFQKLGCEYVNNPAFSIYFLIKS